MPGDLKTRIVLEGEREYARAMSDAARQIKALSAEERLAQAQFKATGDAQEYAAEQARILRDQIALQKQAVAAAEQAVRQLTQQGVQPNDAALLKWKTKLVNARTSLVQLQTRLDGVETDLKEDTTEFGKAGEAATGYGEDLKKIGGTINTQAAIDSIGRITSAIENTVRMAARATRAVVGIATDAGKWADEVKTAADQMDIDPETYQSWQYAATFIDTEMGDISKSWQDIQRRIDDGNNDFAVSLDQVGVATRDASGKLRTTNDIFWDTVDYLHNIEDESTRAAEATRIFGNDWRKINPLIQAGSGAFKDMAAEGLGVATVSNEQVNTLGSMNDAIEQTQLQFQKLQMGVLAQLAPSFERIAKALGDAITSLNEFVQSEEGRAALEALGSALESVITKFTETDENGESGFQKLVNQAAGAVSGLTEGLKWISENSGAVVLALTLMGGAFAALNVTKGVLEFMQLAQTTNWLGMGNFFKGKGATPSAPTGTPTTTPTTAPAGTPTGGQAIAPAAAGAPGLTWGAFLGDALKFAGMDAAVIAAAIAPAVIAHNMNAADIEAKTQETKAAAQAAADAYGEGADEMLAAANMAADALGIDKSRKAFDGSTILGDPAAVNRTLQTFKEYAWLRDILDPATWEALQKIGTDQSTLNAMEEGALLQNITDSVIKRMEAGENWTPVKHEPTQQEIWDLEDMQALAGFAAEETEPLGKDTVAGIAQGIRANIPEAEAAASELSTSIEATIQNILDMHSPSRAMAALGQLAGLGFAEGLASSAGAVAAAAASLGAIASRIPVPRYAGAAGAAGMAGAAVGASFSSSFYIDKYVQNTSEDARALAQRVQDANSWTRAGYGHR